MRKTAAMTAALGVLLLSAVGASGSGGKPIPDVQKLFGQAVTRVRAADHGMFAQAAVYEADGATRGGRPVTTAAGIVRWHFVFQNPTPGSADASVTLDYGPSGFGAVVGHTEPFLEDVVIPRAPKISLARAVRLLRAAGFKDPFTTVTLRDPLGPTAVGPQYLFGIGLGFVVVNAATGRVTMIRG